MLWFWYLAGSFEQIVVIMKLWSPHCDKALSWSDWRYCFSIFQKCRITPHLVLLSSWQTMVSAYLIPCVCQSSFPQNLRKWSVRQITASLSPTPFSEGSAEIGGIPPLCLHTHCVTTGMKVSHISNNFNESLFSHLCLAPVQPAEVLQTPVSSSSNWPPHTLK